MVRCNRQAAECSKYANGQKLNFSTHIQQEGIIFLSNKKAILPSPGLDVFHMGQVFDTCSVAGWPKGYSTVLLPITRIAQNKLERYSQSDSMVKSFAIRAYTSDLCTTLASEKGMDLHSTFWHDPDISREEQRCKFQVHPCVTMEGEKCLCPCGCVLLWFLSVRHHPNQHATAFFILCSLGLPADRLARLPNRQVQRLPQSQNMNHKFHAQSQIFLARHKMGLWF